MRDETWSLLVGVVVAPFGRVGEVKLHIETDFPERFSLLETVCFALPDRSIRILPLERVRIHKGQALLKLKDINSINEAEDLRGARVLIRPCDAMPLPENEYYIHDLIGCTVVTEDGTKLGTLMSVMQGVANDVYVIKSAPNTKEEILLPAVRQIIQKVDIEARTIQVSLIPGLLPGEAEEA